MSIRIHALAKELNVASKELIDFINQRKDKYGLEIKTSSNAIAPLYAEEITNDFKASLTAANETEEKAEAETKQTEDADGKTKYVKTAEDVEEEKRKKQEAEENAKNAEEVKAEESSMPTPPPPPPPAPAQAQPPASKPPVLTPPPVATRKPAPMVPPSISRPKISMPTVQPSAPKQEKSNQPEVTVRNEPKQPSRPAVPPMPTISRPSSPAPMVPPSISRSPAPLVPPTTRRAPSAVPPNVSKQPEAAAAAEAGKKKVIMVKPPIIVRDFAKSIDIKPFRLISELMDMGIFASMNQAIEEPVAIRIAQNHGFELDIKHRGEQQQQQLAAAAAKREMAKRIEDDIKNYVARPPIVCILGHVDHGKTTLLDTIRNTNVVAGEAGGITQHTAAYQVECNGKKITFLDTPGHAAFSKMRERGANVTDIAILVVAADDGFMPQTDEALSFAQKAGVPIVVAINKMDAKGANIDRVKQQMQKRGITSEDWGGEVLCSPISALKNTNIDKLLELVLLQAEMMDLKANPKATVEGVVIESQLEPGRGATSTVIVRTGTMKAGDVLVCGENWCKVRALLDDRGKKMDKATPATPAVVMGWSGAPEAGESFKRVENDRTARKMTEEAILERKKEAAAEVAPKPTSLEELMAAIENKDQKIFKCIVKSDVSGTVEALVACLEDIKSDKVKLEVISSGIGQISKTDVDFAATAEASIVAFNVKQENGVASFAKHKGVDFITHNIIYELINQVREAMKNLLEPELRENKLGAAEVRALFSVSKGGKVAGCMVTEGVVKRDKFARVFRKGKEISKGKISDIKRFKDDVSEVRAGYECGISLNNFEDFETGDIIESFEILEIRPDL